MYLFLISCWVGSYKVSEHSQSSLCKSGRVGESGEAESMNSDSDAGDAADNDLIPQANLPEGDRTEENRSEGRNFLAMLQLAPRTAAEAATPRTATPTSTSASPTPSQNMAPVSVSKQPTPNTTSTAAVKVQVFLFKKNNIFCFIFNSWIYFLKFQVKNSKTGRVANTKTNCGETVEDVLTKNAGAPANDNSINEAACEIIKLTKPQLASVVFNC